jgi:hypothetical protein
MPRGRKASPDTTTLEAALVGLELKKNEIDGLIAKIKKQLGGKSSSTLSVSSAPAASKSHGAPRKRRELSPEARKRIAAAQRRRWAEVRKSKAQAKSA